MTDASKSSPGPTLPAKRKSDDVISTEVDEKNPVKSQKLPSSTPTSVKKTSREVFTDFLKADWDAPIPDGLEGDRNDDQKGKAADDDESDDHSSYDSVDSDDSDYDFLEWTDCELSDDDPLTEVDSESDYDPLTEVDSESSDDSDA
ncbi:hypothetical protein ACFE04_007130 [Oxalis oulophora]